MSKAPSISSVIADFIYQTDCIDIPQSVKDWTKTLFLDAVGNAYASSDFDFAQSGLEALSALGTGPSCVIGNSTRLSARDAVLMNGTLIHGLDYDDTYLPGATHLGASCFPTALALTEQLGGNGVDFLTASILGMEVGTRLGRASKGAFLKGGFHPTSLLGIFASTAVAGRLMQLNASQLVMAQGIALSGASGNMQPTQEGAWAKRLHAGLAGAGAITAATLAQKGFTGPMQVYEGRYGLFPCYLGVHAGEADMASITQALGVHWEVMRTSVKLYPACYQSHAFMNAALEIRQQEDFVIEDIVSIKTLIAKTAVALVCEPQAAKQKPNTSYAASFSLPYAMACCFIRGRFGLAETEPEAFTDPSLLALAQKVSYEVDPNSGFPHFRSGEVIVVLRDGRVLSRRKEILPDERVSQAAVVEKFLVNVAKAMNEKKSNQIKETILNIDQLTDIRDLTQMLAQDV